MVRWVVLTAYFIGMLLIGAAAYKRGQRTLVDFFLMNKTLGSVVLTLTFCAAYLSTGSYIGSVGLNYRMGLSHMVMGAAGILGVIIFGFIAIAPRMKMLVDKYGCISLPDLFSARFPEYDRQLRVTLAFVLLIGMYFYMAAIYIGVGRSLEVFLNIPFVWAVVIPAVIVAVYSSIGGYRAVVWTDVVQCVIIIVGMAVLGPKTLIATGGWSGLVQKAHAASPLLTQLPGGIPLLMYIYLFIGLFLMVGYFPHAIIRFYTVKDVKVFRWSPLLVAAVLTIASLPAYYMGVAARVLFGKIMPDQSFPLLAHNLLPPFLESVLMSAILAAAMSTTNSMLLITSQTIVRDCYQQLFRKDMPESKVARTAAWVTLIVGLTPIIFALRPVQLMFIIYSVGVAFLKGGFLAPMLFVLWSSKSSGKSILFGIIGGTVTAFAISLYYKFADLGVTYAGMTATAISAIIILAIDKLAGLYTKNAGTT